MHTNPVILRHTTWTSCKLLSTSKALAASTPAAECTWYGSHAQNPGAYTHIYTCTHNLDVSQRASHALAIHPVLAAGAHKIQAHLQLDQLLTEWDPSSKDTFDAAAEASLGAASNLLEEATAHFQGKIACTYMKLAFLVKNAPFKAAKKVTKKSEGGSAGSRATVSRQRCKEGKGAKKATKENEGGGAGSQATESWQECKVSHDHRNCPLCAMSCEAALPPPPLLRRRCRRRPPLQEQDEGCCGRPLLQEQGCVCCPLCAQAMSRKAALARAASEGHAAQVASLAAQKEEATRTAHELQLQLTKVISWGKGMIHLMHVCAPDVSEMC
eukprot:1160939-Pelagomonas_calceolata.AAC.2